MEKVFVYGTLKEGNRLNRVMTVEAGGVKVGNAQAQGELRGLAIPYFLPAVRGETRWEDGEVPLVKGELWDVPAKGVRQVLDALEGYYEEYPLESHYLRVRILAMMEDQQTLVECWAYSFNYLSEMEFWDGMPLIPDADFKCPPVSYTH